jgi:hypothetical protein
MANYIQAGVGLSWVVAWGMFGLAMPKDGKNIYLCSGMKMLVIRLK